MEYGGWQQQAQGAATTPQLRPLDIGQKIDAAIKLTLRNFGTLATIVLIVAAPVQLLTVLITLSTLPEDYTVGEFSGGTATPTDETVDVSAGYWVGLLIILLLAAFLYLLTTAACFKAIGHAYLGEKTTWQDSLSFALKRLHSVLWVSTLVALAVLGGFLLLFVGAIWLGTAFALALPALLLENKKGTAALSRSYNLVKGRWWRTFGVLLAGYVLAQVIAGIAQGILELVIFVGAGDDSVLAVILSGLAALVGLVITTPFVAALTVVLYFDLRVRKEAFDLQLLAQAMGGKPPSEAMAGQSMPWVAPPGWGQAPQPGGWGQPQPPAWGQGAPQQQPPGWGQAPPPQQGWDQPQGAPPPAWGQPQQTPAPQGSPPDPRWNEPSTWGQPQQQEPQRQWEPPAPPDDPPPPPQQWEPPAPPDPPRQPDPPGAPDPPDRSPT